MAGDCIDQFIKLHIYILIRYILASCYHSLLFDENTLYTCSRYFNINLLGMNENICILCNSFNSGLYTPFVYVVQKATNELDASKQQAGNILLIIGICNTVSRVITGLVSDLPQVDVMVIQNVAAILAGVATCLVAVLNSMALLYLYAAFFGVTIG